MGQFSRLFKQFRLQRGTDKDQRDELNREFDLIQEAFGNIGTIKGKDGVSPTLPPDGPAGADGSAGAMGSGGAAGGAGGVGGAGGAGGAGGGSGGSGGAGGDKGDKGDKGDTGATGLAMVTVGVASFLGSLSVPLWFGNGVSDIDTDPIEWPIYYISAVGYGAGLGAGPCTQVKAIVNVSAVGWTAGDIVFELTSSIVGVSAAISGTQVTVSGVGEWILPIQNIPSGSKDVGIRIKAGAGYNYGDETTTKVRGLIMFS